MMIYASITPATPSSHSLPHRPPWPGPPQSGPATFQPHFLPRAPSRPTAPHPTPNHPCFHPALCRGVPRPNSTSSSELSDPTPSCPLVGALHTSPTNRAIQHLPCPRSGNPSPTARHNFPQCYLSPSTHKGEGCNKKARCRLATPHRSYLSLFVCPPLPIPARPLDCLYLGRRCRNIKAY